MKSILVAFNKPFNVMCQFTDDQGRATLGDFIHQANIYPAGRLDLDSEGLVLLTNDGPLQHRISDPSNKLWKTYLVQVEGIVTEREAAILSEGVQWQGNISKPARVQIVHQPAWLWERVPSIRYRVNIPTTWLKIQIREGKKRQVRHMTAAVGHPTLRLIRTAIGLWELGDLKPGELRNMEIDLGINQD
jgi:23S rRNA pseudouridine2457 synthase